MNRLAALGREGLVALVLLLGAVAFTGTGVARLVSHGNPEALTLPLALLAADLLIAGALVTRWYSIRPVAQGLAIFGALVHVLVLLRSGPWWIRGWSAVLAAAHIYALLLFFALSAREQYDDEDDELDDEDDAVAVVEPESVAESETAVEPETAAEHSETAAEQPDVQAEEPAEVDTAVAGVTEPDQPNQSNGRAGQPDPGEPDQLDEPEPARSAAGGSGAAEGKERTS
ncbi:MAG TPA: hypothetical protein VK735_24980 [Pseudonocardia sp.]|uniref:hypothetical protein n=1 Tax=Pseudonocardia sp. TaxID=60912 RepID=UPI002CA5D120|nr:hypothetical protein [Pseudonocardia sp.]HTF50709.1 hypothetical protein [Pseudonocardia sp.]